VLQRVAACCSVLGMPRKKTELLCSARIHAHRLCCKTCCQGVCVAVCINTHNTHADVHATTIQHKKAHAMSKLRARGKCRGFSPGAAARHSHHARVIKIFVNFLFCFLVSRLFPHFTRNAPQHSILSFPKFPPLACKDRDREQWEQASRGNLGSDRNRYCGKFGKLWKKSWRTKQKTQKN